jgi:hypothetical protein
LVFLQPPPQGSTPCPPKAHIERKIFSKENEVMEEKKEDKMVPGKMPDKFEAQGKIWRDVIAGKMTGKKATTELEALGITKNAAAEMARDALGEKRRKHGIKR